MKTSFGLAGLAWALAVLTPSNVSSAPAASSTLNVMEMRSVPEGHYLLNLETDGKERLLNFRVKEGTATCVNSSDAEWKGLSGQFQQIGIGTFRIFLQSERRVVASQIWIFRKDGSAAVREIPDRGEMQRAVPVPNDSLERPRSN